MAGKFKEKLSEILARDRRYKADAYEFVMQALWYTQKKLKRQGHVSGKELLTGVRQYGLDQFGPLTKTVFEHWGLHRTSDFGEVVFNMIEGGLMGKNDQDSRDDFRDVFDFEKDLDVFSESYKK
jgi:uncharacterized repeat protein (TIGR04138 family)